MKKSASSTKKRWFVVAFLIGLLLGGTLGFFHQSLLNLGAEVYLSIKEGSWEPSGKEKGEVEEALNPISDDPSKSINTLVLGSDKGSNKGEGGWCRSDVMMLVALREAEKKAVVISIPRDTRVKLPGHGYGKINAAHAYGGPSMAIDVVKELLGMEVHHFASLDFNGFQRIIDAIGGVPIHLSKPINDPHSGYLPAGDLNLTGWQALVLVRSRKLPAGDIDRIASQQAFLQALINKLAKVGKGWKAKTLVDIVASSCQTDYKGSELLTLAEEFKDFSPSNVQFVTLPGTMKNIGGGSYFIADEPLVAEIALEVSTSNQISPELMAKLAAENQRSGGSPAEMLYEPGEDVITIVAGTSKQLTNAQVVAEELKFFGHEKIAVAKSKARQRQTTIYYRPEAKSSFARIKEKVPELSHVDSVAGMDVPKTYNCGVVVVLGEDFHTPGIYAIYGRALEQAFGFESLGKMPVSFD
ncbi:MAG: LCP family protein [Actinomycetota bacterium]|nr:LCP family protein [Actinomycetota bacterium]